jgi:branched-chain amino acid transport system substrate-binding protein
MTGAAAAAGAPIKVGLICTCSGAGGSGAFLVNGEKVYQAWVNSVNAAGGINGHAIQLTTEDDSGTPGTSVSEVKTLISDHVVALVDISDLDSVWASTIQAANIPVVGVNDPNISFGSNPDFYPTGGTNQSDFPGVASVGKTAGVTKMGDFYCAEAVTCQLGISLLTSADNKAGIQLSYSAAVAATAPNYTAQCLVAQQAHLNGVFLGTVGLVNTRIAADCGRQGYNPTYLCQGTGFSMVEATATGLKNNFWCEFETVPFFSNNPAIQAMNAAMDKYYPGVRENPNNFLQANAQSWGAGLLLADALKAGGLTAAEAPTSAEIVKGLLSLHGDTLQGTAPPLTFTAGKPHPVNCWFTAQVRSGVPRLMNNGQPTCAGS